jgi:hypothetical protein
MDQRECGRLQRPYRLHCTSHVANPGREASCISAERPILQPLAAPLRSDGPEFSPETVFDGANCELLLSQVRRPGAGSSTWVQKLKSEIDDYVEETSPCANEVPLIGQSGGSVGATVSEWVRCEPLRDLLLYGMTAACGWTGESSECASLGHVDMEVEPAAGLPSADWIPRPPSRETYKRYEDEDTDVDKYLCVPVSYSLTAEKVDEWLSDDVKQGERPKKGSPNTTDVREYMRAFSLSTNKSLKRREMLRILRSFLNHETRNQLGQWIFEMDHFGSSCGMRSF